VLGTAGGQVQVVAGQVGELVGRQPLDVLAGLVTAAASHSSTARVARQPRLAGNRSTSTVTPGGGRVR
jgi:hypothetical protein